MYSLFFDAFLFKHALRFVGWGDFCTPRHSYSFNPYVRFVPLDLIKQNILSVKSNLFLAKVCSAISLKECNMNTAWFLMLLLDRVIEISIPFWKIICFQELIHFTQFVQLGSIQLFIILSQSPLYFQVLSCYFSFISDFILVVSHFLGEPG